MRADRGASRAGFEGWITNEVAMETFRRADLNFNAAEVARATRGFRAVPMGSLTGSLALETAPKRA